MEVLRALRDVDEVVLLETKEDVSRLNEWKKRPFDCFFSGDDYAGNEYWAQERTELEKLGGKQVEKDSTNSSVPPTQQSIAKQAALRTRSLRKPSGRKGGG